MIFNTVLRSNFCGIPTTVLRTPRQRTTALGVLASKQYEKEFYFLKELGMTKIWNQSEIQKYIDNCIEESLNIEYKGAASLDHTDKKKKEITKDVSAMANSAGGILIYGVAEYDIPDKKHLPERIDSIDRKQFPKERLEHVINNIRPRIEGLVIHPVDVNIGAGDVVYVIEIPQSTTAHQALDHRYYKRFNFESVPMEDYEIRDVMNRATTPNALVEFRHKILHTDPSYHAYRLEIVIKNQGIQVINHFKLEFTIPDIFPNSFEHESASPNELAVRKSTDGDYLFTYWSRNVLFPKEELDISRDINLRYRVNESIYSQIRKSNWSGQELSLNWILFADNMPPKTGKKPISELHSF